MVEFIALTVFIGSLAGLFIILVRKIPVLKEIQIDQEQERFFPWLKGKIKESWLLIRQKIFASDSWSVIIQKVLSKTRILALKIEKRTDAMLIQQREKNRHKKENEDYWKKLSQFSSKIKKKRKKTV